MLLDKDFNNFKEIKKESQRTPIVGIKDQILPIISKNLKNENKSNTYRNISQE